MKWDELYRQSVGLISAGNQTLADERPIIHIDSKQQTLHLVDIEEDRTRNYRVSTAASGLGNQAGSHKTPFGIHRIKEKIGGGQQKGMIFKSREPTGRIFDPLDIREEDEITSRILWLDGMEPGINQGGSNDTYSRYIYIHGTSDETRIGQPVSIGCIRMTNDDVIDLFDEVQVNDLVIIR